MTDSNKVNRKSLSIVDFPVEIILKIFELLDAKARANVCATCKSWKRLAEERFRWQLKITSAFNSHIYDQLSPTRRYISKIQLSGEIQFSALWNFLQESDILAAVTVLKISLTTFRLVDFNNLLKKFPKLEHLQLHLVNLSQTDDWDDCDQAMETPDLVHLKKLFFGMHTDDRLLQCIAKAKLTTFKCPDVNFTRVRFWRFISKQSDLEEINVRRSSTFFAYPPEVTISLKKISFDYISLLDFLGILDLAKNQSQNIETVALGHIPDPSIYPRVLPLFKKMTTLHLLPGCLANPGKELMLPKLRSVLNCKIDDGTKYGFESTSIEEITTIFIGSLPNLQHLELFVPYKLVYFQLIVECLPKLKSLTIRVTFDTQLDNLRYPPVERLRIKCFDLGKFGFKHPPISMVAGVENAAYESVKSLI